MFKDKEKQKEANRLANKVYRDKQKGITQVGITGQGITLHTGPKVRLDNGSYIHVRKLVDPKIRGLITYLSEHLNPAYQGSIRVGVYGPTIAECKELLSVTA